MAGDDGDLERARKRKRSKQLKTGVPRIRCKSVGKTKHVKAFAIPLEREGGVPKKEGPILLVGST